MMKLPGKDIPWKKFGIALKDEYKKDRINDAAGALTYFGVLAVFPFLLFLVALASVIIKPEQAEELVRQLGQVAPPAATQILGGQIRSLAQGNNVGLLSIGALGAIWAASGGIQAVMRALNITYNVDEGRPFWKTRAISILFVLGGGALGLAGTLALVATPAVASRIGGPLETAIMWLRFPAAALLVMFVWACAYYFLPDVKQKFKFITPGSVIGVIVWLIASYGFSLYVNNFGKYDATYGSLGGVIVLLLWMWISAQVLLMGAEINAIIEHWSPEGKAPGEKVEGQFAHERRERAAVVGRGEEAYAEYQYGPGEHAPSPARTSRLDHRALRDEAKALASGPRKIRTPASYAKVSGAFWGALVGALLISRRRTARA